jgi:hypothetical protein
VKLNEIVVNTPDDDQTYVHSGADIMAAVTASFFHDWLMLDIEANPKISDEDLTTDRLELYSILKRMNRRAPTTSGMSMMSCTLHDSDKLLKMLNAFNSYFGPGEWRWAVTVTNWDLDK